MEIGKEDRIEIFIDWSPQLGTVEIVKLGDFTIWTDVGGGAIIYGEEIPALITALKMP